MMGTMGMLSSVEVFTKQFFDLQGSNLGSSNNLTKGIERGVLDLYLCSDIVCSFIFKSNIIWRF